MSASQFIEEAILNFAAAIGTRAKAEDVASSQLEQLIASLESVRDEKLCLLVTASFAYRQAERTKRGRKTAEWVAKAMKDLYERNGTRDDARKLLGLAKWVYESLGRVKIREVEKFQDYLSLLGGKIS